MYGIQRFKTSNCQRHSLSVRNAAIVMVLGIVSSLSPPTAHAQSTTASVFGQAPAGEIVTAHSSEGLQRHKIVGKNGRYRIDPLPAGDYSVTLEKDGQPVDARTHIPLIVGRGTEVDFACPNDHCAASESR